MKKFRWEQDQISNMKEYIARFGHGSAKLARQAQSKEKTLDKMVQGGLTEKVQGDHVVRLRFTDVGKLPPPVLQFADVTFGYSPDRVLYRNVGDIPSTNASRAFYSRPASQFVVLLTVVCKAFSRPVWVVMLFMYGNHAAGQLHFHRHCASMFGHACDMATLETHELP